MAQSAMTKVLEGNLITFSGNSAQTIPAKTDNFPWKTVTFGTGLSSTNTVLMCGAWIDDDLDGLSILCRIVNNNSKINVCINNHYVQSQNIAKDTVHAFVVYK